MARMHDLVRAAHTWTSNAELLADVAELYIPAGAKVLDPTYGRGTWWKLFRPEHLTTHDIRLDGVDFRALPEADATFDVVAYDPPYIAPGGRKTSTIDEFNDRFGLHVDMPRTPMELRCYIAAGLKECARVTKPKGKILMKCMDYVSSNKLFPGTHYAIEDALEMGLDYIDRFEHVRPRLGVQPNHARQLHARRNLSTLLVFEVPRAR